MRTDTYDEHHGRKSPNTVYMEYDDDERRPMLLSESVHMNYAFDIRSNNNAHTPVCFLHILA